MALRTGTVGHTVLFVVPEATSSTGRLITAALLLGNHAHTFGQGKLPTDEVRPLFRRDVLLITAAISESKCELDQLLLASGQRLRDIWEVVPFSKYNKPSTNKPRVFLANPGWVLSSDDTRTFGATIIDASHPRTHAMLPSLIRMATGHSSLRLVVMPPLSDATFRVGDRTDQTSIWFWDPRAMRDADALVGRSGGLGRGVGERLVWVCDSDPETADSLAALYRHLVNAAKAAAGKPYPGLPQCWSVYDRLRQLTVPLAQLEQASSNTWAGSLRERLKALDECQGYGDVVWETTWPGLLGATKVAYETLLKREETAKFWAIAAATQRFLQSSTDRFRIAVGSKKEGELLFAALSQVVDGIAEAMAEGRLEIVTTAAEARLVADGQLSHTILLGPRTARHRHLDVFTSYRVDEFVYPHEVYVERTARARLYDSWLQFAEDTHRVRFLAPLGLRAQPLQFNRPSCTRPDITIATTEGHTVRLARESDIATSLDIDVLAASMGEEREEYAVSSSLVSAEAMGIVEVTFSRGDAERYYANHNVDVFFSESGVVQRYPAAALQRGWQIISFVDGRYEGLFKRLTEVVNTRLPSRERIALELWQTAKDSLFSRYPNKTTLYDDLRKLGLRSSYEAFMSWFDDGGTLAPQQFGDFAIVAKTCGSYSSTSLIEATFEAVRHARGRNRASGRHLKKFLRAVVSGDGYNEALDSARQLDTGLGNVLAAVEVLEVQAVRMIQKADDGR